MVQNLADMVCTCVAEVANLPLGSVTEEMLLLDDLGLDSLACFELLLCIQQKTGLKFDEIHAMRTAVLASPKSLAKYINSLQIGQTFG